jgi:hypothetical protein
MNSKNTKKNNNGVIKTKPKKVVKKAPAISPQPIPAENQNDLVMRRAKRDRVKALEGSAAKPNVEQFMLNQIVGRLASGVKKRGRNKNTIKFKKVRAAFDSFN